VNEGGKRRARGQEEHKSGTDDLLSFTATLEIAKCLSSSKGRNQLEAQRREMADRTSSEKRVEPLEEDGLHTKGILDRRAKYQGEGSN